jgi:DNA-binding transcriptional ArsR family regulator
MPKDPKEFRGFTLPEGVWLPPEFEQLLPELTTRGEIVVLLVVLARYLRPGLDAEPLPFPEIMRLTGLAKGSVSAALKKLADLKLIVRRRVGSSFRYEPIMSNSLKTRMLMHEHEACHDHEHASSSKHDAHACASRVENCDAERAAALLVEKCGVAQWVAEDLAARHPPETIQQHVAYALYLAEHGGFKRSITAYVVASIRDGWGAPKGYKKEERWYTDEEFEKYFQH